MCSMSSLARCWVAGDDALFIHALHDDARRELSCGVYGHIRIISVSRIARHAFTMLHFGQGLRPSPRSPVRRGDSGPKKLGGDATTPASDDAIPDAHLPKAQQNVAFRDGMMAAPGRRSRDRPRCEYRLPFKTLFSDFAVDWPLPDITPHLSASARMLNTHLTLPRRAWLTAAASGSASL